MPKSFQIDDIFFSDEAIVVLKRISNVNGKTNETKEVKQLTKKQIMNVVDQVELKFRVYCSKNPSKTVNWVIIAGCLAENFGRWNSQFEFQAPAPSQL